MDPYYPLLLVLDDPAHKRFRYRLFKIMIRTHDVGATYGAVMEVLQAEGADGAADWLHATAHSDNTPDWLGKRLDSYLDALGW